VFVDETKRRGYLLVASAVVPSDLDATRRMLRGLVLPGQRRLHMKDESDPRKRSIATAIAVSGVHATIYDAGQRYRTEWERRQACLTSLVADAAQRGDAMLIWSRTTRSSPPTASCSTAPPETRAARTCATNTNGQPPSYCWPCPTRSPGAGPKAETGDGASNPSSRTSAKSERARTSAKPERHGRPAGSRAHFPQLLPRTAQV